MAVVNHPTEFIPRQQPPILRHRRLAAHNPKYANVDMPAFNKLVFEPLKPGGTYFIVAHAAAAGTGATLSPTLHRIDEATVTQEVTAAGFELISTMWPRKLRCQLSVQPETARLRNLRIN
jgi:predicted methyltransferase